MLSIFACQTSINFNTIATTKDQPIPTLSPPTLRKVKEKEEMNKVTLQTFEVRIFWGVEIDAI